MANCVIGSRKSELAFIPYLRAELILIEYRTVEASWPSGDGLKRTTQRYISRLKYQALFIRLSHLNRFYPWPANNCCFVVLVRRTGTRVCRRCAKFSSVMRCVGRQGIEGRNVLYALLLVNSPMTVVQERAVSRRSVDIWNLRGC